MKIKLFTSIGLLALLHTLPATAATLGVSANVTPAGALYNYTYSFSVTGAGLALDNIYLGSDDLSPLNVAFTFDGAATSNWSWLGNDTPRNYLQFFSTNGSKLSAGDILGVKFASTFAPGSNQFAIGLDSSTATSSNQVTGVAGPSVVPEPASQWMLLVGALAVLLRGAFLLRHPQQVI
jgi:hypothetical protein